MTVFSAAHFHHCSAGLKSTVTADGATSPFSPRRPSLENNPINAAHHIVGEDNRAGVQEILVMKIDAVEPQYHPMKPPSGAPTAIISVVENLFAVAARADLSRDSPTGIDVDHKHYGR